jgi:hypothetical protein
MNTLLLIIISCGAFWLGWNHDPVITATWEAMTSVVEYPEKCVIALIGWWKQR